MAEKNFPMQITPLMVAHLSDTVAPQVCDMPSRAEVQTVANELEDLTGKDIEVSYRARAHLDGTRDCGWLVKGSKKLPPKRAISGSLVSEKQFDTWPDLVAWMGRIRPLLKKDE